MAPVRARVLTGVTRCLGLAVLVALAACEAPNLTPTEGGYGGRAAAPPSVSAEDPAAPDTTTTAGHTSAAPSPAETSAPAAADTAGP